MYCIENYNLGNFGDCVGSLLKEENEETVGMEKVTGTRLKGEIEEIVGW